MTTEEMETMLSDQVRRNDELSAKLTEIEGRVTPPAAADPDEAYKPKTWKDLHDSQEEVAMRVLERAESKKEEIRKKEQESVDRQNKLIEGMLEKLEKEGILKETKDKEDEGGRQRSQVLGMTLRSGGNDVEAVGRSLKTAWDNGMEYDYATNSFVRAGSARDASRMAPVSSSAARVAPVTAKGGPISLQGIQGDIGEARRRWEESNK